MTWEKIKSSWLSRIFENLHYLGLVLVATLVIQGQIASQTSEEVLNDSVKKQEALRSILWANLLAQRATVFALESALKGDSELNDKAVDVIRSVPSFFPENQDQQTPEQKILLHQMESIKKHLESSPPQRSVHALSSKDPLVGLLNQVDDLGTALNTQESKEWYSLLDQNSKLLKDHRARKSEATKTYILFIFYLGFLGWISYRKKKVELSLKEKTAELARAQKVALEGAHQAGMAEVATGILHNVGNILNSVNVGAEMIRKMTLKSPIATFGAANNFLKENQTKLGEFFLNDPKGSKLPEIYFQLEEVFTSDFKNLQTESLDLINRIQMITDVISLQQDLAKGAEFKEEVSLKEIADNVLDMQRSSLSRHNIQVVRKYETSKPILAQKAKLIHVLMNLIKNAKEAMDGVTGEKVLILEITSNSNDGIEIKISDSGVGVAPEHLTKMFNHGFTTKKEGHGFGLHYCANAITEMGGTISATSAGEGKGTTFTIRFKTVT